MSAPKKLALGGFEQEIESMIHPPAEPGEPICGLKVETIERYYNSRTGFVEEPREWTCTREKHSRGPHIAHANDLPVVKWWGVGTERNGLRLVR